MATGILIKWSAPEDVSWSHSRIYRSSSKTGTYNLVTSIAIGTYSYLDTAGSSTDWYKVSYWDGVNESSMSDSVKGATFASYAELDDIRSISGLTTTDVSDDVLYDLAYFASRQVIRDTTIRVFKEELDGNIDGSNKEYQIHHNEIADTNYDAVVDASDVTVYTGEYDGTTGFMEYTEVTVSSVNKVDGIITLSSAPDDVDIIVADYSFTVPNIDYTILGWAVGRYTAYIALKRLASSNASVESFKLGKLSINTGQKVSAINAMAHMHLEEYRRIIKSLVPFETQKAEGKGMKDLGGLA